MLCVLVRVAAVLRDSAREKLVRAVLKEPRSEVSLEMSVLHLLRSCTCCARIAPARSVVAWRMTMLLGSDWMLPVATTPLLKER